MPADRAGSAHLFTHSTLYLQSLGCAAKMTTCSELAEYEWLTGNEAGAVLEELAADTSALHTAVARLRGRFTPRQTHLLIEQAELRRRAVAKFSRAERMFFTRVGLEQATDEWVSSYKALRFTSQLAGGERRARVADFCCGIGGDLMAIAEHSAVFGVDRDAVAGYFARINSGSVVHVADVEEFDLDGVAALHMDPDRRRNGRRTISLEWCEPNLATIERLLERIPHAAMKLAPACDVPAEWAERCELEWISRQRECRQLIAWHGGLAIEPGKCRATVLPSAGIKTLRTIIGQRDQFVQIAKRPDRFVFDIDPAVLAARLKGMLAIEHGLSGLGDGPTYLTGPQAIADAALACFEVDEVLALHGPALAQHMRLRGIGQLEIKKRGVDIDPEKLRRELRLRGDNAATLLITRVCGRPAAILAHRV